MKSQNIQLDLSLIKEDKEASEDTPRNNQMKEIEDKINARKKMIMEQNGNLGHSSLTESYNQSIQDITDSNMSIEGSEQQTFHYNHLRRRSTFDEGHSPNNKMIMEMKQYIRVQEGDISELKQ